MSEPRADAGLGPGGLVLVVGASGVGKDTILAAAARLLHGETGVVFARRSITRPPHASEPFDAMTRDAFERAHLSGAFALTWAAHGLNYGIPAAIDDDIAAGRTVVLNASRQIVPLARRRYARTLVVLIACAPEIRAARMAARQRESAAEIAARLAHTAAPVDELAPDVTIDNSGPPHVAATRFTALLRSVVTRTPA